MKKLLIVDDEPLALVGMRAMLQSEEFDIEVCATANNGEQALQSIEQYHPDIVITDIKMPVKTGLEVLKESSRRFGSLPVFIILSSYEDFGFAKEALRYGAVEYLVKVEMTQESLAEAISRASARVDELRRIQSAGTAPDPKKRDGLSSYRDSFFARLYFTAFESREQFSNQCRYLGLQFEEGEYAVAVCTVLKDNAAAPAENSVLYASVRQIMYDTVSKFMTCYVTNLDMLNFNLLLSMKGLCGDREERLRKALETAADMVYSYCNVRVLCAVGSTVSDVFFAGSSYRSAQGIMQRLRADSPIAIDDGTRTDDDTKNHFAALQTRLESALKELSATAMYDTMTEMAAALDERPYMQAMNVAVSIQQMAILLLPDGEVTLEQIFSDLPNSYCSIYLQTTTKQCQKWILRLRDGLCENLKMRKQSYKKRLVEKVQKYIRENLDKRLSLTEVASEFHFSPNYLSRLFAQYSECSYGDYVTKEKISAAKAMMANRDKKIYEIAEQLGYSSAFYFSKVFKEATGKTPREYICDEENNGYQSAGEEEP